MPREEMILTLNKIDYHRNGISGVGFWVVDFHCDQPEEPNFRNRHMVATVFPDEGCVAVLDADLVGQGEIGFGMNSWRGDHFEDQLREWIKSEEDR